MRMIQLSPQRIDEIVEKIRKGRPWPLDPEQDYAIGADGGGCDTRTETGVAAHEYCYRNRYRLCDLTKVGAAALNVAANTAFTVTVLPQNTSFFEGVAASMLIHENGNPNAERRARVSAVAIAGTPQEAVDVRNPTAATTAFFLSDEFDGTDYGPRPVPWGIFSNQGNEKVLQIIGFNMNPVAVDVNVCVYGNPMAGLPPGVEAGSPFKPGTFGPAWGRR